MSCSQEFWSRLMYAFLLTLIFASTIIYWIGQKVDPVRHLRRQINL